MRCLIRRVAADGSASAQAVIASPLTIGRSTTCTVQLAGATVALEHALLRPAGEGCWQVESRADTGVEVHGVPVMGAEVRAGDTLRIGDYELTLEPTEPPYELVLKVAPLAVEPAAARPAAEAARAEVTLDLRAAGLRKRRWALAGIAAVLVAGLVVPLALHGGGAQAPGPLAAAAQGLWSPGRISHGHAHFAGDCARCHRQAFAAVPEAVCRDCHQTVGNHAAEAVTDCSACHREHRGPHGLVADSPVLCASCHALPQNGKAGPLAAVTSFSGHPEFTPRPRSSTALAFSHEDHLKAEGIRGPSGVEHLACSGCHAPTASRAEYGMPKYEDGCQRCHRLSVLVAGKETDLPHGNNEDVLRLLQLAGSSPPQPAAAPPVTGLRQRAGLAADRGAGAATAAQTPDSLEQRLCAGCHEVDHGADGAPRVRKPALQGAWMTDAQFSHRPHQAVACQDCHVTAAGKEDTVMMPGIGACQACHTDAQASHGVPTACVSCHAFHRHPAAVAAAQP